MNNINTDVIIVGSGVAGALCADALSKKGLRVVILEAGPNIDRQTIVNAFIQSPSFDFSSGFPNETFAPRPDLSSGRDNYITYSGNHTHQGIEYLRVVGGTTWHWSGVSMRLLPADFKMKTTYGVGQDWPLSYADLEPFYSLAEHEIGVAGDSHADDGSPRSTPFPLPALPITYVEKYVSDKLKNINIPFVVAPAARNSQPYDGRTQCQGFGTCSPICPTGAQYNASVHVKKAIANGAILIDNARVEKLVADEAGKITHVVFSDKNNQQHTATANIFVLAANAIETPKLLLMSATKKFPQGLANRSGLVGKNFFGHAGMTTQMLLPVPVYAGRGPEHTLFSYAFRDSNLRKKQAAYKLAISNAMPLHNIHITTLNALGKEKLLPPQLDDALSARFNRLLTFSCLIEQLPNLNNQLTLNWDKLDSAGQPSIHIKWDLSDYETAGAEHAKNTLLSISKQLNATDIETYFPWQHHHPMGTTRMGNLPSNSVVDGDGKTHDHPNLYLISSSVFPTGGTANPTLTIAALSLRTSAAIIHRMQN